MSRVGGGAAARVLAGALRLLPPHRADWARAMRAELAAIDAPAARWRFLLGCLRVVAIQRMTVRSVGRLVLVAGALAGALVLTRDVADVALRVGLVALVAVPLAVSWLARRRWLFGPAAGGWTAGLVGAGGYLLVGALVLNAVVNLRDPVGVPVYPVLLTGYLVGFLALTAHRGAATGRVLAAGALSGLGAAALWLAIVLAAPPVPANIVLAVELTAVAMVAAGFVGRSPVAALCAGTVAVLLIVLLVAVLSEAAPASFIPDLARAALSRADDLAQSRIEVNDPYVGLLFLGSFAGVALMIVSVATRRPIPVR